MISDLVRKNSEAVANLQRLLGPKRWIRLTNFPFELRIPARHPKLKGMEFIILDTGRLYYYNPRDKNTRRPDGRHHLCRGPVYGLRRVPAADKILAAFLWILTDEMSFYEAWFPKAKLPPKGKMAAWDQIFSQPVEVNLLS